MIATFSMVLYFLALPFTRYSPLPGLPVRVAYADLVYLIVLAAGLWMWHRYRWHGPKLLFYEAIALGLVGLLGLQTVLFHQSLRSAYKVIGILYLVSLPIVCRQVIRSARCYELILQVIVGLGGVLAVTGIVMYGHSIYLQAPTMWVIGDQLSLEEGYALLRLRVFGYTPNMFAALMHLGIVAGLWLASSASDRMRYWVWLCISLMCVNVVLCKTRLLLGVLISLGLWWWWHRQSMTRWMRRLTHLFMTGVLAFGMLVGCSLVYSIAPVRVYLSEGLHVSWNQAPSPYAFLNVVAVTLFHQHPWTGIGLGQFRHDILQSEPLLQAHAPTFAGRFPGEWFRTPRDPHSTYQGLAAETGLFGIGTWCFFLALLVRSLARAVANTHDPTTRRQQLALLAGIIGFMVQGVYLDILSLRYFWCLVALAGIVISPAEGGGRHDV